MDHSTYFATSATHRCADARIDIPVGARAQLAALLGEHAGGLGMVAGRRAAKDALALMMEIEDEPSDAGPLEDAACLGRNGRALGRSSFEWRGCSSPPFAGPERYLAQVGQRARRLGLAAPKWAGIAVPEACLAGPVISFETFEPFQARLSIVFALDSSPLDAPWGPEPMSLDPRRFGQGGVWLGRLALSAPAAAGWIEKAMGLSISDAHAYPLLSAWSELGCLARARHEKLARGPLRLMSRADVEAERVPRLCTVYALYIEPSNGRPGGFVGRGELGPLSQSTLFPSAALAVARAQDGSGFPHAVARLSLRLEGVEMSTGDCRAPGLRRFAWQKEAGEIELGMLPVSSPDLDVDMEEGVEGEGEILAPKAGKLPKKGRDGPRI